MRALEFLNEIAMNPNSLQREAAKINARAGCEFEMYVPNAAEADDDFESEPDYDQDEKAMDIDDIINFFSGGDGYNDRRELQNLRDELDEAYSEWAMEQQSDQWDSEGMGVLKTYIEENDWDEDEAIDQAMNDLGFTAEEKDAAKEAGDAASGIKSSRDLPNTPAYRGWNRAVTVAEGLLDELVEEEYRKQGTTYDRVYQEWSDDWEYPEQRDFLRDNGITHMSDVENKYTITWPYRTSPEAGDLDIDTVGEQFSKAMGKKVMTGRYHGAGRSATAYSLEPDSSLDSPDDSSDGGLEFISPPMSIPDIIADLKKVKEWADKNGCYTNESTGLHINVSVPQGAKRDYVKLALLLGDDYILQQFGREANTFCKSALNQVKHNAMTRDADAKAVLEKMRTGLGSMASQAIHSGNTNKYISINNKGDYIEFRSPGGDWLNDNFDKIETTLLRTVVALDAASDPQKYRREYLKKLYKILTPMGKNDPISYFAQYAAGELPKSALKSFLKAMQQQRTATKGATVGKKYWYKVSFVNGISNGATIEVAATSPDQAKALAIQEWGLPLSYNRQILLAVPVRPYEDFPESPGDTGAWEPETTQPFSIPDRQRQRWNRWDITYRDGYIEYVTARNQQEAMESAKSTGHGEIVSVLADPSGTRQSQQLSAAYDQAFPPSEAPDTTGPGEYALVDSSNNDYIHVFTGMANRQEAHDAAVQWLTNNGDQFDPERRRYFQLRRQQ